jgi:hypothetical protein
MPALPPVPGVLKVSLVWAVGDDPIAYNNLHWSYSGGPPSNADCATIAGNVRSAVVADLIPQTRIQSAILFTRVTDLTSPSAGVGESHGGVAGGLTGPSLPNDVCVLVNASISRRYRGGKPRCYWPGGNSTYVDTTGKWIPADVTTMNTAWNAFITAVNGMVVSTTTLGTSVNVSYYSGFTNVPYGLPTRYRRVPTLRAGGPHVDIINAWSVNPVPGNQRRRNIR